MFGAQSSGGFAFGQSSSAAVFGSSSSPFGAFGQTSLTPQFGQSSSVFGQSSQSLFGAFGASSKPLFGQSQPAFGQSSQSIFGQSFGGFGLGQSSSQGFSAPGGFGFQSSAGLFSSQPQFGTTTLALGQQQQQQLLEFPIGQYIPQDLEAVKDIEGIRDSIDPQNSNYRFRCLFLNRVDDARARVKPVGISEQRWQDALCTAGGRDNPDKLWPVQAVGYQDLIARNQAQDEVLQDDEEKLQQLKTQLLKQVENKSKELEQRKKDVEKTYADQTTRLLQIVRKLDLLNGRFAREVGLNGGYASRTQVLESNKQLQDIELELQPPSGLGLIYRVKKLADNSKITKQNKQNMDQQNMQLTQQDLQGIQQVLSQNNEALQQLQEVVRKQERDIQIMEQNGVIRGNQISREYK